MSGGSGAAGAVGHRSLAAWLRSWPDARVAALLVERPDLATPAPADFGQLASRATVRASLLRALDELSTVELHTLDALVVAGETPAERVVDLVHAAPDVVRVALDLLLDRALAWPAPQGLRAVTGAADALAGRPGRSGLWPGADPPVGGDVAALVEELSPAARGMLERLVADGVSADPGSARRTVAPGDAASPAEELLSRRLLVGRAGEPVVRVPGEVGLALRGGRTTVEPVDAVPALATSERDPGLVDRAAAGAAFELVRRVDLLLDEWGRRPPAVLRSGGLGVRDLKAASTLLDLDAPTTALVVELSAVAGLLGTRADAVGDAVWVPTDDYDAWADRPAAERWTTVARAWLDTDRAPGLVGTRDPAGKARNALTPEAASPLLPTTRRAVLRVLAGLASGTCLAAGTGLPSLVDRLAWERPRRPAARADVAAWTVTEAAALGVTGLGGLASFARALLDGDDPATGLAGLLPAPVDHVLIQADLTAVAPGPLVGQLARTLQLVADVESRGGATVYRFTAGSVRRALDVGWTAVELHDFIGTVSRTPVPQPLTYLVDDAVRRFGTVRVGAAESFVRADDEAALTELLHLPGARGLGLRRLAPTVLVSTTPVDVLLPRLRDLGAAPVVEAPDGTVQVVRPDALRARARRPGRTAGDLVAAGRGRQVAHESARASAVVAAVRAGDRAARPEGDPAPPRGAPLTPSGALAALRAAIEDDATVVIGYVDNQGVSADRVIDPLSLDGGTLTARDHRVGEARGFAVHRITTVARLDPPSHPPPRLGR